MERARTLPANDLDHGTSSPAIVGRAILEAIAEHPGWEGRVGLALYGNPYPDAVVARALASAGVQSVVSVVGPIPHDQVADILARADLLFITLPARTDGSRGGRISAKTYEYLTTDRPILAAVPQGENRDYLAGKPGVWLVDPADEPAMRAVIAELVAAKFAGRARSFDREPLRAELAYEARAREFELVIDAAIAAKISPRYAASIASVSASSSPVGSTSPSPGVISSFMPVSSLTITGTPQARASAGA